MAANFDLSNLALKAACPGNEILYDDRGLPSVMVRIPKMTYAQLGMGDSTAVHPAFIVNGQEVDEIYISKFMNIIRDGRAYSLPGQDYANNITFDSARQACEAKGDGWHLMTRMEWGLLLRWCQQNGIMPKGNNNYGKHSTENSYKAIPMTKNSFGQTLHTAGGTGPLTWFHDQTPSGIADLVGNGWEWNGGIRTVYGELQMLANNNGADSANSQAAGSLAWKAIKASDGTLIDPDGSGTTSGSVKMDWISSKLTYSTSKTNNTGSGSDTYSSCSFDNIVCDSSISDEAKLLLADLGLYQYEGATELFSSHMGYFDNTQAERLFRSGGTCNNTSSGLGSFDGSYARSTTATGRGLRAAYSKLPSV